MWIDRFTQCGQSGYHELSRRSHACPGKPHASPFVNKLPIFDANGFQGTLKEAMMLSYGNWVSVPSGSKR